MSYKFELGFFNSARVGLVVPLHKVEPPLLLHPVVTRWWGDGHLLAGYLQLLSVGTLGGLHF